MGFYTFINELDRITMRIVKDPKVKEAFEEALQFDRTLMIFEYSILERKNWFGKPAEVKYFTVYHEQFLQNGHPSYEARQQQSASGKKEVVIAYLHGIINASRIKKA